ncbi:hypothetical protein FRC18_002819 [Serendipita sp. 400]|nr:hypothetical protein FRC18_002819 [Serendipita sp. 400]
MDGKMKEILRAGRRGLHSAKASLVEEFSKFSLRDDDSGSEERLDEPRPGEGGTRESLEGQSRRGRDAKTRKISLRLTRAKEKAPDGLSISDALRSSTKFASVVAPSTKAEEKEKKEDKPEGSEVEVCLPPEGVGVIDASDDALDTRGRSRGRRPKSTPYPSTSRTPSRLPSHDWHPTEESPPTNDDIRTFGRALEELDKDHQSIVTHYGGNTFWTRWLVLEKILEYHNKTGNWPMRVERTGSNRANAGVHHAECAMCNRGRDNHKLKVQHIAKHLTSEEWKLKPWRCMLCSAVYSYNDDSLKTHVRNVHAKDESDPQAIVNDAPNPTFLNPVTQSTSAAVQGDRSGRSSNEYVNISPAYTGSTGHLSPQLATPSPSFHQLSNSQPAFDIMRSPPTDIPHGGQPVASTYTTSLFPHSSRLEDPIVWSTQPPLLGATPTVGDPSLPSTETMFDTTLVPQPYMEPPSLPHQFDIQQAFAASGNAGTSIAPSSSGDSVSLSTFTPLNRSGSFSSGSRAQYQQPIQGAIDPNHIPIPSVVNPLYKVPPSMGYVPGNTRTDQPPLEYWGHTIQATQAPGSSNIRSNQPTPRSAPAPTEPRLQGQQRPQMINTQLTPSIRTSQPTARTRTADLIGHSHPSMPKGGPISGPALKAAIQAPRSIKPSTN